VHKISLVGWNFQSSSGRGLIIYMSICRLVKEFKIVDFGFVQRVMPVLGIPHLEISDILHNRCIQDTYCSMIFPPTRGKWRFVHVYMLVVNPKPKGQHSRAHLESLIIWSLKNKFGTACCLDKFMATLSIYHDGFFFNEDARSK